MLREVFQHPIAQIIAEIQANLFCPPDVKVKTVLPAEVVKIMQHL